MNNNEPLHVKSCSRLVVSLQRVIEVDDTFCALTGYSQDEILGRSLDDILSLLRLTDGAAGKLALSGQAECWLFTKLLEAREVTVSRHSDGNNDVYIFAEKPRSRLEEVLPYPCQLLEENMVGISIFSASDFTLLKANQIYLNFGDERCRNPASTFGRTIYSFINGFEGSAADAGMKNMLVTGRSVIIQEMRFEFADRGMTYWDSVITPLKVDGKVKYIVTNVQDVTERVAARTAQVNTEKQYKSLFDTLQSGIIQYDRDGTVISMNPAASLILGMAPERFMGSSINVRHYTVKTDGSEYVEDEYPVMEVFRTGKPVQDVMMGFINPEKKDFRWININAVPFFRPGDTKPYRVFTIFDDFTEQKRAEDALKKSEATLRSVLDNSGDFIYSFNVQTNNYEYVSPSAEKVLGCSTETFMATDTDTYLQSIHPDDLFVFDAVHKTLKEKNETEIRFRQRVKSGEYRWFSNHLTDVRDADGNILFRNGRIRDITEQVKSDEVIRYQASLLQNISDMVIASDENLIITSWNKAAELTYGWTEAEAVGQHIHTLLHTQFVGVTVEEVLGRLFANGSVEVDAIDTCKDGRKISVISTPHLITDASGKVTGIIGIFRNITDRKKMEDALRESELHLRFAAKGAKLGTYRFDFRNHTVYASDELKALWGLEPDGPTEVGNDILFKGVHPDDLPLLYAKMTQANDPGGDGMLELDFRINPAVGVIKWLHMRGQTTFGDVGGERQPIFAAGVVIDITERVAAENSIRELSEELQNIIDSTDDYIYSIDSEFRLVYYNAAFNAYAQNILGKRLAKGIRMPEVLTVLEEPFWRAFYHRVAREGRIRLEIADEGGRILSLSFNPVFINGQMAEMTIFAKDVTERVKAEYNVREISEKLQNIIESTDDYIYSIDLLKRLLFFNSSFSVNVERFTGKKIEKGMRLPDVLTMLSDSYWEEIFSRASREGRIQTELRTANGRVMSFSFNPVKINGLMTELTVFGRDVTERVAAESSVREMSEELQNIIESTDDYIGSVDRDYRIILYNSAWSDYMERRFGCRMEKGMCLLDMLKPEHAAVWTELIDRTVTEGKYQIELRIDEGARVMSYSFNPVYLNSEVVEITVFGRDVTQRVNSEREIIQLNTTLEKRVMERTNELQQSVSNLRNFTRIISHDLKEPIRQVEYAAGCIGEATKAADIEPFITEIRETCLRMTRFIESLSKYAMSSELSIRKEKINVRKLVSSIFNELKGAAKNSALLQFESGMPIVRADKILMEHVLRNLLSNALKFSSKKEVSEITAGCMEENYHYIFYIRDNGVGFDMQYAHKLFNVFERLHADEGYEGSGIGLAAVRNIINRHGGSTWIESKENAGTTVYFTLPVGEEG